MINRLVTYHENKIPTTTAVVDNVEFNFQHNSIEDFGNGQCKEVKEIKKYSLFLKMIWDKSKEVFTKKIK